MTSAHPVAYYLRELSGEPSRRGPRGLLAGGEGASDLEVQIAEAHARGVLEGQAAGQIALEEAARKQAAALEQALAAERQRWSAEQGALLGALIASTLGDIEQRISDCVAHILQPMLGEQVRAKATGELTRLVNDMLGKGECGKITISGPQDLLAAVEAQLTGLGEGVAFVVAETADMSVSVGDTIMETRIGAWADAIRGERA